MRTLSWLLLMIYSIQPLAQSAQLPNGIARDYGLGLSVGTCLITKCQIFQGFLLTPSMKPGDSAVVQVAEQLFGPPLGGEVVKVPYGDPNDLFRSGESPNRAWRGGVTFSTNAPVMVTLALEDTALAKAGQLMLVTSDEIRFAKIRFLIKEALQLEANPDAVTRNISIAVESLARNANPVLAGYFLHASHPARSGERARVGIDFASGDGREPECTS
jgi:hypothetical protein